MSRKTKNILIPLAFIAIAGPWGVSQFDSQPFNSTHVKRAVANSVEIQEQNQESALSQEDFQRLSNLAVDIHSLNEEIKSIENKKAHISKALQAEQEDESINELNEALKEAEKSHSENKQRVQELESIHQQETQKLLHAYKEQEQKLEELKEQAGSDNDGKLEREIEGKLKEIESLSDALVQLEGQLEDSKKSNVTLSEELKAAREKIGKQLMVNEDISKAYCKQKDQISSLEKEIEELLADKEIVTNKVIELTQDKESFMSKVDELEEIVSPKKDKNNEESDDYDAKIEKMMSALTQLSMQVQFNNQILNAQRMQMPNINSLFQNTRLPLNRYESFHGSIFPDQNFFGAQSLFKSPSYFPSFSQNQFSMPELDFSSVRRSYDSINPNFAPRRDVGSVIYDFNQ